MGYVVNRHESIATNVNRILSEQVDAAIDALQNPGGPTEESIHDVRKRIKKIRAMFRLVRSEMDKDVFRRENSRYQQIGHQLSHVRDATVMIQTIEKLRQTHPDALSPNVFATLKKALAQHQERVSRAFFEDQNNIGGVVDAFRQAPLPITGLSEKHNSFSVLAPNLKRIYRRGRKALQVAKQKPSSHNFHELRKDVKTIWYHTLLLKPIWPGVFGAYGQEIGRLGDLLGDDHDFGVLAGEIETGKLVLEDEKNKETIVQLLHQHRATLQKQIHPVASRIFAEKTDDFVGRYRLYWKLWRAEAKRENASDNVEAP